MFGKLGYDQKKTFDCKWELDSLASFLQLSSDYYNATGDLGPFTKYQWVDTVETILAAAEAMQTATYTPDGMRSVFWCSLPMADIRRARRAQWVHHERQNRSGYRDDFKQWHRKSCHLHGHGALDLSPLGW